jgi:hypothetical protein
MAAYKMGTAALDSLAINLPSRLANPHSPHLGLARHVQHEANVAYGSCLEPYT